MWEESEQNNVIVLYIKRVSKHNEKNHNLRGSSIEFCLIGGLLAVHLKSYID